MAYPAQGDILTQQLERPATSTPVSTFAEVPELWVLCLAKANLTIDITEVLGYLSMPKERVVLVSDQRMYYVNHWAQYMLVGHEQSGAELWNLGLQRIRSLHRPGDLWDVLLLDPNTPLSQLSANSLRYHMRTTDVWMAEPDVFGEIQGRNYQTTFAASLTDVYPTSVVVAGENAVRFDQRVYDDADAWVDYCQRTRTRGGSVRVSSRGLRENVL